MKKTSKYAQGQFLRLKWWYTDGMIKDVKMFCESCKKRVLIKQ